MLYSVAFRGLVMTGRLLDCMPPNQTLVLSSGVWWSLLLNIRCLWRQHDVIFTFANQRFG